MQSTRKRAWLLRLARRLAPLFFFLLSIGAQAACSGGGDTPSYHAERHHKLAPPSPKSPQGPKDPVCPAYDPATPPELLTDEPPSPTAEVGTIPGSFSVTSTGEAVYSMPLAVLPARAGLEPHLANTTVLHEI